MCKWSLAYVTHHVDGSRSCSHLALFLGVTERLVVEGLFRGEQGRVDKVSHEDWVDNAEEIPNLRTGRAKFKKTVLAGIRQTSQKMNCWAFF